MGAVVTDWLGLFYRDIGKTYFPDNPILLHLATTATFTSHTTPTRFREATLGCGDPAPSSSLLDCSTPAEFVKTAMSVFTQLQP
ncbi:MULTISPECIES: hypothetical protein [Nitrosomonas]|uniref:hypothetical protein n=1 Tax=Nitrosomonas TaxID=914 RepID=UPI0019367328|nr:MULTISPECIES: hypothetical protein [Nitrosomonas]QOJ09773.1 MAG: hypothetical protein HRU73_10140 [Nitrosomonas sp. H1_AOB3]HRO57058.1 hypothetical protein [Nitrosomonas europaea]HUM74582.1 hypothetical protein [Nitrosomonas europaea]